jgi:hypothetical protein
MPELNDTTRPIGKWIDSIAKVSAPKRAFVLAIAFLLALSLVILCETARPVVAQQGSAQRLPDLRMASFQDMKIREYPDGRRLLRFTTIMVNVGAGPFEVHGQRLDIDPPESMTSVTQRIYNDAGGYSDIPTPTTMFYSRDGHDHWHLKDLQRYTLKRLNSRESGTLRVGAKEGFCFFDYYAWNGSLPGFPERRQYVESQMCGEAEDQEARHVVMGLSVGWSDVYEYVLPFQWIDITGLPPGRYRLYAKVDVKDHLC